jgi:phage tail-like protein
MALDGKHLADQYSKSYGFKVEITGGAGVDSNEGAWRSCRGGGIRIHESGGCTVGPDQFKNHTRGICEWDDLVLAGAVTKDRKQMLEWYKAMQEKGKEADCYRDVTITLLRPDGTDYRNYNYLECWLTSYSLCPLNAEEDDVEAHETIEIVVGYSDNFFEV